MQNRLKQLCIYLPAVLTALFLSACENDINKVKAIAAADATKPVQRTTGVTITYSDSGFVKAQIMSPLLIEYATKKDPYKIMPNGVKVISYTRDLKQDGNIIADTGYFYDKKELIVFRKNVVATKSDGTVYRSEELIWDQAKKQVYSNKKVKMTKVGGDEMTGTSFVSDDKLRNPVFQNSTAIIHVDDNLTH